VLTTFEPELAPDCSGLPVAGSVGFGLALALTPVQPGWTGLRLRVGFEKTSGPRIARRTPLDLFQLLALLDAPFTAARSAPLQDLGQAGQIALWVEGHASALRCDLVHVPAVHAPHVSGSAGASSLSSHGVEAQR
jgi:hypothetical protein